MSLTAPEAEPLRSGRVAVLEVRPYDFGLHRRKASRKHWPATSSSSGRPSSSWDRCCRAVLICCRPPISRRWRGCRTTSSRSRSPTCSGSSRRSSARECQRRSRRSRRSRWPPHRSARCIGRRCATAAWWPSRCSGPTSPHGRRRPRCAGRDRAVSRRSTPPRASDTTWSAWSLSSVTAISKPSSITAGGRQPPAARRQPRRVRSDRRAAAGRGLHQHARADDGVRLRARR